MNKRRSPPPPVLRCEDGRWSVPSPATFCCTRSLTFTRCWLGVLLHYAYLSLIMWLTRRNCAKGSDILTWRAAILCLPLSFFMSCNDDKRLSNEVDNCKHSNKSCLSSPSQWFVRVKTSPCCSYSLVSRDSLMHNAQNMRITITDIWLLVIQDIATLRGWPCTHIHMYNRKS